MIRTAQFKRHLRVAACAATLCWLLGLAAAQPAQAMTIVISPGATLSANSAALAAFNRAANQWSAIYTDPITITINADLQNMGSPTILGSTNAVVLQADYNTIRNAMVSDAAAEPDDTIVSFLPTAAQFTATLPANFSLGTNILATKANLKALGFTGLDTSFGVSDATMTFNSGFAFDYDRSNGLTGGTYDFESVAAHEIGHVLGFISSVDTVDQTSSGTISPFTLDLFRFAEGTAADPATQAQFTTFARLLSPNVAANTDDIDNEWRMSTGQSKGDGRQASHWLDINPPIGIMDPTLASATTVNISNADMRAFDLIGYNLIRNDTVITAPAGPINLGTMIVGYTPTVNVTLNKTGTTATTYSVSVPTGLTQSSSGSIAAGTQTDTVALTLQNNAAGTGTIGAKTFSVTVDNTAISSRAAGQGNLDPDNVFNVTATVLDHASGSINVTSGSPNFGNVLAGSSVAPIGFNIAAGGNASTRAGLQVHAVSASGSALTLSGGAAFDYLVAAGTSSTPNYSLAINTNTVGAYSATQTFTTGDDQSIAGHNSLSANLALTVTGKVYAAAALTANTATTLDRGSAVSIQNAAAAPLRATAYIDSYSISSRWTLNGLSVGNSIAPGSGTPGASVSFNQTGLLNGQTFTGLLSIALENDALISGSADKDLGTYNWNLSHAVSGVVGTGTANVASAASYAGLNGISDKELDSTADLLAGTNTSGTGRVVSMSWRNRSLGEASGFADSLSDATTGLVSDVVSLAGTDGTKFVLQMSVDTLGSPTTHFVLAWLDEDDNRWKLAIDGNQGPNTDDADLLDVQKSWLDSGAGLTLGAYGYDPDAHTVWAVLDHNSEFAALEETSVPEPGSLAILSIGAMSLLGWVRFKRRR
ncbi:MAG: NF038122 family metalloprotease [Planctomycetia bacterium]|nr:NF038122 family metalloprotease [Planctomycetia bacterium]